MPIDLNSIPAGQSLNGASTGMLEGALSVLRYMAWGSGESEVLLSQEHWSACCSHNHINRALQFPVSSGVQALPFPVVQMDVFSVPKFSASLPAALLIKAQFGSFCSNIFCTTVITWPHPSTSSQGNKVFYLLGYVDRRYSLSVLPEFYLFRFSAQQKGKKICASTPATHFHYGYVGLAHRQLP